MTVLYSCNNSFLINHCEYISNIFKTVVLEDGTSKTFTLSPKLFFIKNKKSEHNNKRIRNSEDIIEETQMVRQMYIDFIKNIPNSIQDTTHHDEIETKMLREHCQHLFESTQFNHNGINGGNNSDEPLKCLVKDNYFLIPPQSRPKIKNDNQQTHTIKLWNGPPGTRKRGRPAAWWRDDIVKMTGKNWMEMAKTTSKNERFLCGCVKEQCKLLKGNKYDIVIADPPWWNKYIRRLKSANDKMSYSMMYNEEIASIPVKDLFADNCLVAIWCTNAPSNIDAVKNLIFSQWGVKYLATWYWLKLTVDLEPLCNFGSASKKQPYERVIIGSVGDVKDIPDKLLFASVPSALHSHKPPLLDLLQSYVDIKEPAVLELFARYLLPHTTSVGYEPLKWQHVSLYDTL